jgi:hypothetical protein
MRLPYRQRFSFIINELGAAVASRSEDLRTALRRADPALAEADNLLALLASDANTIRDLNTNADSVVTALADNSKNVQRFIVEANRASTISATQAPAIEATWRKLPAFLEQLRPALAKLGTAADAQIPVFQNLNAASANLKTFFQQLAPFSHASIPSLKSLGQASAIGKSAVQAATPAVGHLNQFAKPTPELAQNLSIVLQALDTRTRTKYGGGAIEADPRSPAGGHGYSGLEGLLMYAFNITNAIDYFGPWGHQLGVNAFANSTCSPYATPATIASAIQSYVQQGGDLTKNDPSNPRTCYAYLGPNQPGVNQSDPSFTPQDATPANPSKCVPDPGGYPVQGYGTHYYGPTTNACKLTPSTSPVSAQSSARSRSASAPPVTQTGAPSASGPGSGGLPKLPPGAGQTISGLLGSLGLGQAVGTAAGVINKATGAVGQATGSAAGPQAGNQAQQLLNYLLAP